MHVGWFVVQIMKVRYIKLGWGYAGLVKTGVPLIGFDGTRYLQGEGGDDIGMFLVVPQLMARLHLALEAAIATFVIGSVVLSFGLGWWFAQKLFEKKSTRCLSALYFSILGLISIISYDLYLVSACSIMASIPVLMYGFKARGEKDLSLGVPFYLGLVAQSSNYFRSHSGTPIALFFLVFVLLERVFSWKKKSKLAITYLMGAVLPILFISSLVSHRQKVLRELQPDLTPYTTSHSLWHSVYVGTSYLNNEYGTPVGDYEARMKVAEKAPDVIAYTGEYEKLVKQQVVDLAKAHPFFIVRTVFSKMGILLLYAVCFLNFGFIAMWFGKRTLSIEAAFVPATLFSLLPGILVTPYYFYVLGYLCFLSLYALLTFERTSPQQISQGLKDFFDQRFSR